MRLNALVGRAISTRLVYRSLLLYTCMHLNSHTCMEVCLKEDGILTTASRLASISFVLPGYRLRSAQCRHGLQPPTMPAVAYPITDGIGGFGTGAPGVEAPAVASTAYNNNEDVASDADGKHVRNNGISGGGNLNGRKSSSSSSSSSGGGNDAGLPLGSLQPMSVDGFVDVTAAPFYADNTGQ